MIDEDDIRFVTLDHQSILIGLSNSISINKGI